VVSKHRLTFGSPLVVVFFLENDFPKIPNLVWVLEKNQDLNSTAIFKKILENKNQNFRIFFFFFENDFAHISTLLLVW